jgi:hypothetical protein
VGIETDAEKDLALSDNDAEGIVGGKKAKKTATKHAATTHKVTYINVPGYTGTPDDTLPASDCDPDETTTTT